MGGVHRHLVWRGQVLCSGIRWGINIGSWPPTFLQIVGFFPAFGHHLPCAIGVEEPWVIAQPNKRDVLTGFLAVDSETNSGQAGVRNPGYGRIRLLELPRSSNVPGPGQVQNYFNSSTEVSQVLNVLGGLQGSQVIKGNLLTLPVGGGLLYVQPVYVQSSSGTQYPLLRKVLVAFGDKVGFADTLSEALNQVFGGDSGATTGEETVDGDAAAANDTSTTTAPSGEEGGGASAAPTQAPTAQATTAPPTAAQTPTAAATASPSTGTSTGDPQADLDAALSDIQTAKTDADQAMKDGDWAKVGEAQNRLSNAIDRAVEAQKRLKG